MSNADDEQLSPGYERVFTVYDYYDGPRSGIADFLGKPHLYECVFDEKEGGYSNLFRLTPIGEETFRLALEDWEIWQRWEHPFHAGEAAINTHPALPKDARRHAELKRILDKVLVTDPKTATTRVGQFDVLGGRRALPKGVLTPLQVEWTHSHLRP